jgi:catechol 2,3-dioxygenase-like lactoylglutathione lyase family enzyme
MRSLIKILAMMWVICGSYFVARAQVQRVAAVGITVRDMDRSVRFYNEVLGFKKLKDEELQGTDYEKLEGIFGLRIRVVRMRLGDEQIQLTSYLTSGGRSIPEDARSNDLIFQHIAIVVSDMDLAYQRLRKYRVMHVSTAPQTIPASNTSAAGIRAFYFHDPDMHALELIYFPRGKGQAKWQQGGAAGKKKLFLGIDHTAIGVSNTDSSLHFYQGLLGMERKGDSWNMGMEQAHLNFVEGASLHITGLRAAAGPGIEFLQYLQPGPGKPYPADTKADDLWHWQTLLWVKDAAILYEQCKAMGYAFVSRELVTLHNRDGMSSRCFIVRDPDGHAMLIIEKNS